MGAGPSCLVGPALAQDRSDGAMGSRGRAAPRSSCGHRGASSKDRRDHVCDLAGRQRLRRETRSSDLVSDGFKSCDEGGGEEDRLSKGGDRGEHRETSGSGRNDLVAPMATRRRILTLVPLSTNSRLGQPAFWSVYPISRRLLAPWTAGRGTLILTGQSLHSRAQTSFGARCAEPCLELR